jgi:hypothetical protein
MKTRKALSLSFIVLAFVGLFITSCTKENNSETIKNRPLINRTINYTVLVVAGETSATGSGYSKSAVEATGATGATVQVAVNGSVLSKTTDISGQATFTNLTAGIAAVTVNLANHTTVNYVVNLYHMDTILYDNESQRIASTKVVVFPTSGTGMITVSGIVKMKTDVQVTFPSWATGSTPVILVNNAIQYAPTGTVITAEVPSSELNKYVTSIGTVTTDVTYEGLTFTAATDASGNYSISVPSTAMGLSIDLLYPDIAANITYSVYTYSTTTGAVAIVAATGNYILGTKSARYVFGTGNSSVTAFTGKNEIVDFTYTQPSITDPDYFGF